jgi:hypothetical protein
VKRYVQIGFLAVLLAGICWGLFAVRGAGLPRKRVADGGEFRVVQITYGAGKEERHYLDRAPEPLFWLWRSLPDFLRSRVPRPDEGLSTSNHVDRVISIWWTWFDQAGDPYYGPTDYPLMTLDSGKQIPLRWPSIAGEFRQIIIDKPPTDSKRLRLSLLVNDEQVEFEIANPAFKQ